VVTGGEGIIGRPFRSAGLSKCDRRRAKAGADHGPADQELVELKSVCGKSAGWGHSLAIAARQVAANKWARF